MELLLLNRLNCYEVWFSYGSFSSLCESLPSLVHLTVMYSQTLAFSTEAYIRSYEDVKAIKGIITPMYLNVLTIAYVCCPRSFWNIPSPNPLVITDVISRDVLCDISC